MAAVRRGTKKKAMERHFRRRCGERLGYQLGVQGSKDLVALIQRGEAMHLEKQSCSRSLWRVEFEGVPYVVVYDKPRKVVVTIWPEGVQGE